MKLKLYDGILTDGHLCHHNNQKYQKLTFLSSSECISKSKSLTLKMQSLFCCSVFEKEELKISSKLGEYCKNYRILKFGKHTKIIFSNITLILSTSKKVNSSEFFKDFANKMANFGKSDMRTLCQGTLFPEITLFSSFSLQQEGCHHLNCYPVVG